MPKIKDEYKITGSKRSASDDYSALPDLDKKEQELARQLQASIFERVRWRSEWQVAESSIFDIGSEGGAMRIFEPNYAYMTQDNDIEELSEVDNNFVPINYNARNFTLIFSQLMSNTPVAMGIPESNDERKKEAAKGAEFAISYGRSQYDIDDMVAQAVLSTFLYGIGFLKQTFDYSLGYFISEGGNTAGSHKFSVPRVWDVYLDPNAKVKKDIVWVTERLLLNTQDAIEFFGEDAVTMMHKVQLMYNINTPDGNSLFFTLKENQVEVFERWETGTRENNWKGRLIYHLRDGRVVKDCGPSPCQFSIYPEASANKGTKARLPYHILTYEDIPYTVWGRSPAVACARAQNMLNACYSVMLETARNMGIPRIVYNKATTGEDTDTPFKDSSVQLIPLELSGESGGTVPFTMQAANTSPDMKQLAEKYESFINDRWGVNDSLLGKQQRETQGITMQLSIMQGNMIRERFFNKYVFFVEDIYKLFLAYAIKHWKSERVLEVLGENNKFCAMALKGADIAGGYTIRVERNLVFALDPLTRQEQIKSLQPLFQSAGMDQRYLLKQLRLADLRSIYDKFDLADDRAKKNIEWIKEKHAMPKIYKFEDHIGIVAYLQEYEMTEEFINLDEEDKDLIEKLIDKRLTLEAKNIAQPTQMPPQMGAGAPPMLPQAPPQTGPGSGLPPIGPMG